MRRTLIVTIALLIVVVTLHAGDKPQTPSKDDLKTLEVDFLSVIKGGDGKRFLRFVSSDGLMLGVEPARQSRAEIRRQLEARTGIYCLLFDSDCLNAEARRSDLCSYKELLSKGRNVRVSTSKRIHEDSEQVEIMVEVSVGSCGGEDASFIFGKEKGMWRLQIIPYT